MGVRITGNPPTPDTLPKFNVVCPPHKICPKQNVRHALHPFASGPSREYLRDEGTQ